MKQLILNDVKSILSDELTDLDELRSFTDWNYDVLSSIHANNEALQDCINLMLADEFDLSLIAARDIWIASQQKTGIESN